MTAIGGTTKVNPEVAAGLSGGGFSNYFARPSYQNTAVTTYLHGLGTTNSGLFKYELSLHVMVGLVNNLMLFGSATGRAYPDLAAQARGFQIVVGGTVKSVDGTSASAPVSCPHLNALELCLTCLSPYRLLLLFSHC